ncbi:uncharacterized protein LOC132386123 [Hypanus sabinus]|uniref:uncharacterized protein LOC132386123 n=1 Tax=Hypanus sabinus TaxID=79690 RepID=UPI0028C40A4D|nr:uncharacterized protein LOC132386123 [Hypanus sabinus]
MVCLSLATSGGEMAIWLANPSINNLERQKHFRQPTVHKELLAAARPHTHTANQRPALGEGCAHWLRSVSGREAEHPAGPEFGTGTEWAGDRELRLGFRLHHRRVVNPFEGRAGETGGDSVRCFSYTEAPGLSPPRIGACCLELSPRPVPSCRETGAAPQRLPVDPRSSHRSPVQSERLKTKGEQGAKWGLLGVVVIGPRSLPVEACFVSHHRRHRNRPTEARRGITTVLVGAEAGDTDRSDSLISAMATERKRRGWSRADFLQPIAAQT